MHIGILKFKLMLPNSASLKAKRKIIKSLCDKIRHHFNVGVAEVDDNDRWQTATIGITFVSNSTQTLNKLTTQLVTFFTDNAYEYVVLDHKQDIITGF